MAYCLILNKNSYIVCFINIDWKQGENMLEYIPELLLSAAIGCFTNYIALKMMFRPYKAVRLFGLKLPFTPGMIPSRKDEVAQAIGQMVGRDLIDNTALLRTITSDTVISGMNEKIMNFQVTFDQDQIPCQVGKYAADGLLTLDFSEMIADETFAFMKTWKEKHLALKLAPDEFLKDISTRIGERAGEYIKQEGRTVIADKIELEVQAIYGLTVQDILKKYQMEPKKVCEQLNQQYRNAVTNHIDSLMRMVNISGLIEEKIISMDMPTLEKLIFNVMKKELHAIVYLGAFIGFVMGLINIII